MAQIDREAVQQVLNEIEELLSMRQGFQSAYRKWRPEAAERVKAACGTACAEEFEQQGPNDKPINRQHRVHLYRQTLSAQSRYLNRLLESEAAQD